MSELDAGRALTENVVAARALHERLRTLAGPLDQAANLIGDALLGGRKLLCCGNGGSAADCAHLATEIAGRYKLRRKGFPAVDLTGQHALMTALINDYPAEEVFARAVQAMGAPGDVLVVFSTSGNSENVRLALEQSHACDLRSVAFLGNGGGACRGLAQVELIVPHEETARIQEAHQLLYHTLCDVLDPVLARAGADEDE